jgi:hypothetical protein
VTPEMLDILAQLRKKYIIGFVGGSDFRKIAEQLAPDGHDGTSPELKSHYPAYEL